MRLLFVTNHAYLPQRVGGAEFSTHDLCRALLRNGNDVAVLAKLVPGDALHLRNRLERKLLRRQASMDRGQGYPVFRTTRPASAVNEALQRVRPDVAILHPDKAVDLLDALVQQRQPVLVYLRDAEFHRLGFQPMRAPGIGFVANSNFTATAARQAFGIDAAVIPPLIQHDRYLTKVTGEEVLFVNPVPEKGVELALEIAAACPTRHFRFVEGWPLNPTQRAALESRVRELGNVVLQPPTQDMRPVYARARALIAPSRWAEAWGRIVTEAQLNGIPVLATRIGGLPESVGDGGILFEPADGARAWAHEIERLFDDPSHFAALSDRARARAAAPELSADVLMQGVLHAAQKLIDGQ